MLINLKKKLINYVTCTQYFSFLGTAYIHGIKHATGNFIILMDADLSHHVSTLVANKSEEKSKSCSKGSINKSAHKVTKPVMNVICKNDTNLIIRSLLKSQFVNIKHIK